MTETRTYSTRGYAVRAARSALKDRIPDAMSGVHFKLEAAGDEWTWHEIDVATGDVAAGELVVDGVTEPTAFDEAAASGLFVQPTEPAAPVKETRDEKRRRLIAEADARNATKGAKAPKAPKAAAPPKAPKQPKEGGVVANKVGRLLELVQSEAGLTETQLKTITGWTKFGGFYAAVKNAGLTMTRTKVEGENVWKVAA